MSMDIFDSGVDENSTPDITFDITPGGTKTWQGGMNAKEPVCLNAFAWLCIMLEMQQCLRCNSLCTHVCCSQIWLYSLSLCVPMSCNQTCASTSSSRTTQTTARQTMHVSAPVSTQYIYSQVVPYVPVPDTARQSGQISGQIAALQQLYSSR